MDADPFLKAKMKYLIDKQKPYLINQMPKIKIYFTNKKNINEVINEVKEFTTLKSHYQKENNKKLYLLVNANLSS